MNGLHGVRLALSVVAVATAPVGRAEVGTETSLGYSDNIDRIETGGRSEQLLAAMLGGQAGQPYGDLERHVLWQLGAINYLGDTYDDEVIASLDGAADFALLERRVSWHLEDQLGQQALDPFAPVTPESREYVNFFTSGPDFLLPISSNVAFAAALRVGDVWYEEQTLSNTRSGGQVGLQFGTTPKRSFGVVAGSQKVMFDDEVLHTNYEQRQLFFQYETERRRSTLSVSAGTSELHGLGETNDTPVFEVDWERTVSGYSTFGVLVVHGFSDAGELFQIDQTFGEGSSTSEYVSGVSNPMERTYASLRFVLAKPRTSLTLSASWTREDYTGPDNVLNRDIPMVDARFSRNLSSRMRFEFGGSYTEQDSLDVDHVDRDRRYNVGLVWTVGPRGEVNVAVARYERASTSPARSYVENRAFVTFSYGVRLSGLQMNF